MNVVGVPEIVVACFLGERRDEITKVVWGKAVYNLIENNELVLVSSALQSVHTDFNKELLDTA